VAWSADASTARVARRERRCKLRSGCSRALTLSQAAVAPPYVFPRIQSSYTDLRKFLDTSVSSISGHIAGASYRAGEAGAQATAQSERTKPVLVANRFHAVSQASMMSAKLRNTELASQWLRR
jgi:hypothetical protein